MTRRKRNIIAVLAGVATFGFVQLFRLGDMTVTIPWSAWKPLWGVLLILWVVWVTFLVAAKLGHPIITVEEIPDVSQRAD